MNKSCAFLLLFLAISFLLKAIDPNVLVGKPFVFDYRTYGNGSDSRDTVPINLDCFYNYTSTVPINKLVNNENRYYLQKKYTCPDSIYRHRFVGVDFIDKPKKGSYFIFLDNKGDSVLMTFPKFNPSSEYHSTKNSYAHRSIRSIGNGYNSCLTFIDLTVSPLGYWESRIDTILSSQQIAFRHPAVSVPSYKLLRTTYVLDGIQVSQNNEYHSSFIPTYDILKNDSIVINNANVVELSYELVDIKRKIATLQNYIRTFDNSLIDKASVFLHSDVWIDEQGICNAISPSNSTYDNGWKKDFNLDGINRTLSSAALGGNTYKFYLAYVSGITLLPNLKTIVERHEYRTNHGYKPKVFSPTDSLEFQHYLILKHSPDSLYSVRNSLGYYSDLKKYGREFTDSCFIPLTEETLSHLIPPTKMNEIHDGFYQREQQAWDEFSEEQRAYYDIASRVWGENIAQIVCRGEVRLGFNEDMCHFAFMRTPYRTSSAKTPLGIAECQDFFMEGVKLYFQNDILIGIEWRGNSLFEPRHRY